MWQKEGEKEREKTRMRKKLLVGHHNNREHPEESWGIDER